MVPHGPLQCECQHVHFHWLGDEVVGSGTNGRDGRIQASEGRHHDDGYVRSVGPDAFAQFRATHSGHLQVGKQDLEVLRTSASPSLDSVNVVHVGSNFRRRKSASIISHIARSSSTIKIRPDIWSNLSRQIDREFTSFAGIAVEFDPAPVILYDAVGNRQAQPCALANLLGREERFK